MRLPYEQLNFLCTHLSLSFGKIGLKNFVLYLPLRSPFTIFEVPYNGTDNNDYVDGQGFCCDDGSPEAAQARALALENNFQDPDAYEKLQFYYHPDHLGSSSYITNLDGEVVQHIEYVPFGEVFIEERNSIWNTPYLFNAKEFDEETGLYYYGARYYDPRLSLWNSVDPISSYDPLNSENYLDGEHNGGVYNNFNLNPYLYCYASPMVLYDPDGRQVKAIKEWWERNSMTTRTEGLLQGVLGTAESVAGAAIGVGTGWTGAGAIGGSLIFIHGADVAATGFHQMITGKKESTLTSYGLQAVGISRESAEFIDASISLISVGGGALVKSGRTMLSAPKATVSKAAVNKTKASFFDGAKYTNKVRGQMKSGDLHSFPESVRAFEADGTVTRLVGGDGVVRTKLSIPGRYKGKDGVFEFIKEPNGDINHRFFNAMKE